MFRFEVISSLRFVTKSQGASINGSGTVLYARITFTRRDDGVRVAFFSTHSPRECGIATFNGDLVESLRDADPRLQCSIASIDEKGVVRGYGSEVKWRAEQGRGDTYVNVARQINSSGVDAVVVQHEFGLYGTWDSKTETYVNHLEGFFANIRVPVITVLHTVQPETAETNRDALRFIANRSEKVVVMAETAVKILREKYGIVRDIAVIPHGMPPFEPRERTKMKDELGLAGRTVLSTFGLVDPRKGIEYAIQAMPEIVRQNPSALYLVIGKTHPDLVAKEGEKYRQSLVKLSRELGVADNVRFVNRFATQEEIAKYLAATDVYVVPYLDPTQITSGTLVYALGAGRAIVCTKFAHANEVLSNGRGVLVDFRNDKQIADNVNDILANPIRKAELERLALAYGRQTEWPAVARKFLAEIQTLVSRRHTFVPGEGVERRPVRSSKVAPVVDVTADKSRLALS